MGGVYTRGRYHRAMLAHERGWVEIGDRAYVRRYRSLDQNIGVILGDGATPYFGDGYPIDWPDTADALAALAVDLGAVVVPGHGDHGGAAFANEQAAAFRSLADLSRLVHAGELSIEDAASRSPFPPADSVEPLERALAQLRGELGALGALG